MAAIRRRFAGCEAPQLVAVNGISGAGRFRVAPETCSADAEHNTRRNAPQHSADALALAEVVNHMHPPRMARGDGRLIIVNPSRAAGDSQGETKNLVQCY
jgi:hypothetical protein